MGRILIFMVLVFTLIFHSNGQLKDTISVTFKDLPLTQILDSISLKSGYSFIYNSDLLPKGSLYYLNRSNISLEELLAVLLIGSNLDFERTGDQILLVRKNDKPFTKLEQGQSTVLFGRVVNKKDSIPISGVNVFLNGTTLGTSTDSLGYYTLNCGLGVFQVVYSHIEYDVHSLGLRVSDEDSIILNTALEFRYKLLPDVEVQADPLISANERSVYYAMFRREFLGTSTNGYRCTIENPEVLDFSMNPHSGVFKAYAEQPLIIINQSLGYRIEAILEYFEKDDELTRFHVKARFYELDPNRPRQLKSWTKNRQKVYSGSKNHFFEALIENKLEEEGFKIYSVKNIEDINNGTYTVLPRSAIFSHATSTEIVLRYPHMVLVEYLNEKPDNEFIKSLYSGNLKSSDLFAYSLSLKDFRKQRSLLRFNEGALTIEKAGLNYNKFALDTFGYWSWERIGEFLPVNYEDILQNQ